MLRLKVNIIKEKVKIDIILFCSRKKKFENDFRYCSCRYKIFYEFGMFAYHAAKSAYKMCQLHILAKDFFDSFILR